MAEDEGEDDEDRDDEEDDEGNDSFNENDVDLYEDESTGVATSGANGKGGPARNGK